MKVRLRLDDSLEVEFDSSEELTFMENKMLREKIESRLKSLELWEK